MYAVRVAEMKVQLFALDIYLSTLHLISYSINLGTLAGEPERAAGAPGDPGGQDRRVVRPEGGRGRADGPAGQDAPLHDVPEGGRGQPDEPPPLQGHNSIHLIINRNVSFQIWDM